ncbi:MAG: trypsin-like peptidase domain-containing protein [Lachnospiraceae bacterium]|nr:trypsin-like peptidase domain-containing protein [Lachnospiraceae bacterium]
MDNEQNNNQYSGQSFDQTQNTGYDPNISQGFSYAQDQNAGYDQSQNTGYDPNAAQSFGYGQDQNAGYNYSQNAGQAPTPEPPKKKGGTIFLILIIVVVLLLCCCGVGGLCGGGYLFSQGSNSLLGLGQQPTITSTPQKPDETESSPEETQETKDPYLAYNQVTPTPPETSDATNVVNLDNGGAIAHTNPFTKDTYLADVVEEILPSVVCITINYEYSYSMMGQVATQNALASGSGVIISQDDDYIYIVTNNHVVSEEDSSQSAYSYYYSANLESSKLTVTFCDGTVAEAEIRGTDNEKDLAVIAVKLDGLEKSTKSEIKMATLGSSKNIRLGDQVIAIGNAMGFGTSVTSGIVSALNRDVTFSDNITRTLLQTDAAINPGNSGGGLFDRFGNLIAINSAKYADTDVEGIGYAIPISDVTDLILDLIAFKPRTELSEEEQGFLGVSGQDIDEKLSSYYDMPEGIYLTKIVEDSPAQEAGLMLYDVITAINGTKVTTGKAMTELIKTYAKGEEITVTYSRLENGSYINHEVSVVLSSRAEYLEKLQREKQERQQQQQNGLGR